MNTIVVYSDKISEKLNNNCIEKFIYDSFTIVVVKNKHEDTAIIFDVATNDGNPNDCSCRVTMFNQISQEYEVAVEFNWYIVGDRIETKYRNIGDNKKFGDVSCSWADYIYSVMAYIMTTQRERTERPKGAKIFNAQKVESKRNRENKIYLLDEIVDYVNENGLTIAKSGNRAITCPCWDVRGHYRHYKSGKVVFIKNYEKGKEKGKVKPKDKTYTI